MECGTVQKLVDGALKAHCLQAWSCKVLPRQWGAVVRCERRTGNVVVHLDRAILDHPEYLADEIGMMIERLCDLEAGGLPCLPGS